MVLCCELIFDAEPSKTFFLVLQVPKTVVFEGYAQKETAGQYCF